MRFYDRDKELNILNTNWNQTTERGRLKVVLHPAQPGAC